MRLGIYLYKPFDNRGRRTVIFQQKLVGSNFQQKERTSINLWAKRAMYIQDFLYIKEHKTPSMMFNDGALSEKSIITSQLTLFFVHRAPEVLGGVLI